MRNAGFTDIRIVEETNDFLIEHDMLADPDQLFCFSPLWPLLAQEQQADVLRAVREAQASHGGTLPIPSTALIATARRG